MSAGALFGIAGPTIITKQQRQRHLRVQWTEMCEFHMPIVSPGRVPEMGRDDLFDLIEWELERSQSVEKC